MAGTSSSAYRPIEAPPPSKAGTAEGPCYKHRIESYTIIIWVPQPSRKVYLSPSLMTAQVHFCGMIETEKEAWNVKCQRPRDKSVGLQDHVLLDPHETDIV